jgi:UDP-N-acetyl-D-glucosamine/UDP-N-acetyl-D-galactosamine dehydrogenase
MTAGNNFQKVGIIGLGYVGLPLAVEFGKVMPTVGFDINTKRIAALRRSSNWCRIPVR